MDFSRIFLFYKWLKFTFFMIELIRSFSSNLQTPVWETLLKNLPQALNKPIVFIPQTVSFRDKCCSALNHILINYTSQRSHCEHRAAAFIANGAKSVV